MIPYQPLCLSRHELARRRLLAAYRMASSIYRLRCPRDSRQSPEKAQGVWLLDLSSRNLTWIGPRPVPKPTFTERLTFAYAYIRSNGNGSACSDLMKRLVNAVALILKPLQVESFSGKPIDTDGLSIEEAWYNLSLTACVPPQSGQGKEDNLDESSSSLD